MSGSEVNNPVPRIGLWREELAASLMLAWPFVLMQLAQISINTTLMLMVGKLGATELAGAALGLQVFLVVFFFDLGLAIAVAPLIAQARGAGDLRLARRALRQGLWTTTLVALPGAVLLWFAKPALLAAGQDPAAVEAAADFMRPMAFGLAPWLWFYVLRNYMAAMGRPRPPLYVMVAGILLNAVLGYLLIFGAFGLPPQRVLGAGLAALLVGCFLPLSLALLAVTDRRLRRLHAFGHFWRPDWPLFREIFRVGTPIGLAMLLESLLFMALLYLQGLVSTVAQAAHAITMQWGASALMLPLGLSQAATVRVGLAVGGGDAGAAKRAAAIALGFGLFCALLVGALFLLVPRALIGFFLDTSLPESGAVIAAGVTFLTVAAFFQLFDGLQVVATGALRGLKDTRMPTLISGLSYWLISFPLAMLLAFVAGLQGLGIWLGLTAGLIVATGLMVLRVRRQLDRLSARLRRQALALQSAAQPA